MADDRGSDAPRTDRPRSPKTGDIELGRRIAERREELDLSRKQLAEATGLSYPFIAQIETGYRLPSARHQVAVAKVLGLSLDELFGTDDDLPPIPERLLGATYPMAAPIEDPSADLPEAAPARAVPPPGASAAPRQAARTSTPPAFGSARRRTRGPSLEEAIERAAQEIEALPESVRLDALSRVQLRIMQGIAGTGPTERGRSFRRR